MGTPMNFYATRISMRISRCLLAQVAMGLVFSNWIGKRRTCHNFYVGRRVGPARPFVVFQVRPGHDYQWKFS